MQWVIFQIRDKAKLHAKPEKFLALFEIWQIFKA